MLEIVVCVKAVPDPKEAFKIRIDSQTKTLTRGNVPFVMNQVDKNAVEAAVKLKEELGAIITVLSMGPPPAKDIIKEGLAMGADKGVLLSDRAFGGADVFATAFTLVKGIEKVGGADLVICGMESSDGSTAQVGAEIAALLNFPVVTGVKEFMEYKSDRWRIKANMENGYRVVRLKLPAVLTVTRDLNKPRSITFSSIVKARKKEMLEWDAEELGVPIDLVGLKGSPTIISELRTKKNERIAEIIDGERGDVARILIQRMAEAGVL